jgi:lipopolysaccharide transport system permease protein
MAKQHENYKELIWVLAKTDFKLRYHSSVLGYFWALLKPLMMFAILNFVFSSLFANKNVPHYSLQLLVSIVLFNFFSEGTMAGMNSLMSKAQLVTKIYVPRWTIILASTLSALLVFLMNIIIIIIFFAFYRFVPSAGAVLLFFFFTLATYILIVSFSLLAAPIYAKLRDLSMIWEVLVSLLFYASPVIYPLKIMPVTIQKIELANPMGFIINFTKLALISNQYGDLLQWSVFLAAMTICFLLGLFGYRKFVPGVAEEL